MKRSFRLSNEQLTAKEKAEAEVINRLNDDWNLKFLRREYGVNVNVPSA